MVHQELTLLFVYDADFSIRLRENCQKSFGSVRRDRVYCSYAEKCGTERVSVLNPASFGKLVRIIFPNVQTRRLGVRGESKYHYVDLTIREPNPNTPTEIPEKNAEATPSRQKMADKSQEKCDFITLKVVLLFVSFKSDIPFQYLATTEHHQY